MASAALCCFINVSTGSRKSKEGEKDDVHCIIYCQHPPIRLHDVRAAETGEVLNCRNRYLS